MNRNHFSMTQEWLKLATHQIVTCYYHVTEGTKEALQKMIKELDEFEELALGREAPPGFASAYTLLMNEAQQVYLGWDKIIGEKFEYIVQDLSVMDRALLHVRLELEKQNNAV